MIKARIADVAALNVDAIVNAVETPARRQGRRRHPPRQTQAGGMPRPRRLAHRARIPGDYRLRAQLRLRRLRLSVRTRVPHRGRRNADIARSPRLPEQVIFACFSKEALGADPAALA
jgi:hypothetical protein